MNFGEIANSALAQFVTVWNAPAPFLAAVLLAGWLIWRFTKHTFETRIANAVSTIELQQRQLLDYKEKLGGATPDELKAQFAALEARVQKNERRRITKRQRAQLADGLRPFAGQRSTVRTDSSVEDAMALFIAIHSAMNEAGWGIGSSQGSHFSHDMPSKSGLVVLVPDPANLRGQDAALIDGLRAFGLELEVQAGSSDEVEVNITRPDEEA